MDNDDHLLDIRAQMAAFELTLSVLLAGAFMQDKRGLDVLHQRLTEMLDEGSRSYASKNAEMPAVEAERISVIGCALLDRMIGAAKLFK